ncbi:PLP-dependent enzyme, glutamate decarboxylase [Frankia canadensis]|uniref:PLP-dependent enzyme, glutamate decarboxylase n=1 Tax=Frankia canadensis TaxID=1836972 RepID=A0A2I2KX86_9ACTN|nr:pyridoxal-dependent decarboxylase [Frankia canadensis]SNQ50274.1 PLP-dependent enzyme, glutamate decarboxylase [Frankia canadensis]SOU57564.1 PLP-dependent enzyme, glutamate decarboxylase [Frankia canadensis]
MTGPPGSDPDLTELVDVVLAALADGRRRRGGPLPAGGPGRVRADVRDALGASLDRAMVIPAIGDGPAVALARLTGALAAGSADPADPRCAAHLHCPPLAVAVAADLAVSALNPSLDSWDQAPAATTIETEVIAALARLVGFDPALAAGTITTGGTESNLMGLLLARDAARRPTIRVFRSAAAHLSVDRAAAVLGLDDPPVLAVPTDERDRMRVDLLRRALAEHAGPAVVVATAGTTDAGAVDPLPEIAAAVEEHRLRLCGQARAHLPNGAGPAGHPAAFGWLHVDAAYGGGVLFSKRLDGLLAGIAQADSVALDLHKLGWQPIPAGVFLTPRPDGWPSLRAPDAEYLRSDDDEAAGFTSLLDRSLRTTRRADSFPIAVTLRALGRDGLGARVDACHELARHAERTIRAEPRLELAHPVTLTTVVFRYRPPAPTGPGGGRESERHRESASPAALDTLNAGIRRALLVDGRAVVGRTRVGPDRAIHLKLTLLNPEATPADVDALIGLVLATGDRLSAGDAPAGRASR